MNLLGYPSQILIPLVVAQYISVAAVFLKKARSFLNRNFIPYLVARIQEVNHLEHIPELQVFNDTEIRYNRPKDRVIFYLLLPISNHPKKREDVDIIAEIFIDDPAG